MQYDQYKLLATTGARSICPTCKGVLIAICGQINVHHWRHESLDDCDPWSEGETAWHLAWKQHASPDATEVTIANHRADIKNADGTVIELQHSPIDPAQMRERENFYGDMVWLFDCRSCAERITFDGHKRFTDFGAIWRHAKKHIFTATKPVYLDLGNDTIFAMRAKNANISPAEFTGYHLTYADFVGRFITLTKPQVDYDLLELGRRTARDEMETMRQAMQRRRQNDIDLAVRVAEEKRRLASLPEPQRTKTDKELMARLKAAHEREQESATAAVDRLKAERAAETLRKAREVGRLPLLAKTMNRKRVYQRFVDDWFGSRTLAEAKRLCFDIKDETAVLAYDVRRYLDYSFPKRIEFCRGIEGQVDWDAMGSMESRLDASVVIFSK